MSGDSPRERGPSFRLMDGSGLHETCHNKGNDVRNCMAPGNGRWGIAVCEESIRIISQRDTDLGTGVTAHRALTVRVFASEPL